MDQKTTQQNEIPINRSTGLQYVAPQYNSTQKNSPIYRFADAIAKKTHGGLLWALTFLYGSLMFELIVHNGFGKGEYVSSFSFAFGSGMVVLTLLFYIFFLPFIFRKDKQVSKGALLSFIPVIMLSILCGTFSSLSGKIFAVFTLFILQMLHLTRISGISKTSIFSFNTIKKTLYHFFIYHFETCGRAYSSIFSSKKDKKLNSSAVGRVLIGLIIAIPAAVILIICFSNADDVFKYYVDYIIDKIDIDFSWLILDCLFGFLISLFLFPWIFALRVGDYGMDNTEKSGNNKKGMDSVIASTFIAVCTLVYIAFVIVQFTYLFAENRELPAGMSHAEYGRSGFFELSSIIIFTFLFITFFLNLTKRKDNGEHTLYLKSTLTLLALCNLVFVASAFYRMFMYTDEHGLTRKRVTVLWMIAVVSLWVLIVILKIWVSKFKVFSTAGYIAVTMIFVLNLVQVDRLVAKVNIDRYLNDDKELDYSYLARLSTAAAPEVKRLLDGEKNDVIMAESILGMYKEKVSDMRLGKITIDDVRAEAICDRNNIKSGINRVNTEICDELVNGYYDEIIIGETTGNIYFCGSGVDDSGWPIYVEWYNSKGERLCARIADKNVDAQDRPCYKYVYSPGYDTDTCFYLD